MLNNNEDKLLATDNLKTNYNSIEQLFNLKIDKNTKEVRRFKEPSAHETFNPYLNYKQFNNNINFNTNYLNTEIYPKDTRNKNKIIYYNFKLLNKKSLLDDKIILNSIIKTLQNQEYFKSKTPIGHSIINKAKNKKNVLSNSTKKEKQKYNSHSPGFRRYAKINNNHFRITNHLKFPRKNNFSVNNHNNSKNNYFLLNENIFKNFDPQKFFLKNNNKNIKPNKKFLTKDNNNNAIKRYSKSIKNSININSMNTVNKKKGKTISSAKTNLDGKKSKNRNKLNLRKFECCLSSKCSKKKNPIIESNKKKFNGNFPSDNYNKNKKARNLSKKSLNKQKGENIQLSNPYNNYDVNKSNKNFITNTEFRNNKIVSLAKNKINLNKLKIKNKNKKNKCYNLLSKNLNYINNKENQDKDNIIINLNILKPNIFLDRQKSSKKPINNKIGLNSNSIHLNNNYNIINSKVGRTRTESSLSNFNFTMRNNNYDFGNKNKNKNYKNLVASQIKKSVEINKKIKSIQDMHKMHGSLSINKKKFNKKSKF